MNRPPVLDESVRPNPVKLFSMLDGRIPARNILGMGDPDVHRIGGRWWMFFGAFHTGFKNNIFSASLPPGAPLDSRKWKVTAAVRDPHRAVPVVEQPPKGNWDYRGLHNPSYVAGCVPEADGASRRERIYYTGRNSRAFVENDRPLSIGVIEKGPQGWTRHSEPVLRGGDDVSVLEPKVRYLDGKWRMWYVATPKVAGRKTLPNYEVRYVESEDGLTGWSEPRVLFSATEGFYDAVVTKADDSYEMVTCRSGNLGSKTDFPHQGIWWLASRKASGERTHWTREPLQILDADETGEDWYGNGVTDTSVQYDGGRMFVFFTGVHRETNWFRLLSRTLLRPRRLPVPAPFYISIGCAIYR